MPFYECVFIARQDISAPQVEAIADHFVKVVEEGGGTISKREYWGLRSLSYRIRKNRKGHYMLFNVEAAAPAVHEMERQMRLSEDIIRHLTIRVDELQEGPSAMMQTRASRDDRPRREDRFGDRPPRGDRGDRRSYGDGDASASLATTEPSIASAEEE